MFKTLTLAVAFAAVVGPPSPITPSGPSAPTACQ